MGTAVTGIEERYIENNDDGKPQVHITTATFNDGTELDFGCMIWSAGLSPVKFVQNSGLPLSKQGRILTDKYLRVSGTKGRFFAIGDCATIKDQDPLPPTASVAEQQAYYVGDYLNLYPVTDFDITDETTNDMELPPPGPITPALMPWTSVEFLNKLLLTSQPEFQYKNRGAMASMGLLEVFQI